MDRRRKMGYEQFHPLRATFGDRTVTLTKQGVIRINSVMAEYLTGYRYAYLLFDQGRELIGIKPVDDDDKTYKISRRQGCKAVSISGIAFLKHFDIDYSETRVYLARSTLDMIEVCLRKYR